MTSRTPTLLVFLLVVPTLCITLTAQANETKLKIPGLRSLTVNGEFRLRFEDRINYDLNDSVSDDDDFVTQRARLGFTAEINHQLQAVLQFQDVRKWGEEANTTEASADAFDVHQAYVRWADTPLGGVATLGRQMLAFGDERLVGALEWVSQGRVFDGMRHTWKKEDSHTLDAFVTFVRELAPSGTTDDAIFAGVYWTLDAIDDAEFDAYLLYLNDEETAAGGTENRTTLGSRYQRQLGSWELGAEAALQFGEVDGADVDLFDAYALHAHATYRFEGERKPWVRVEVNYATGDDPGTAENERFNNLFPTGHAHLGMMDFALWENTFHTMLQAGLESRPGSKLMLSWHRFDSVEETDAYRGPVNNLAPGGVAAGTSNHMGDEIDLLYNIEFETEPARTWLQAGYGLFVPGNGARAAAGDDDLAHFLYLMSGVKF